MRRPSKVSVSGHPSHRRFDLKSFIKEQVRIGRGWQQMRQKVKEVLEKEDKMPMPSVNGAAGYPKRIVRYLHCALCMREQKRPSIEMGVTPNGLQVWCRVHNCNIAHFELGPMDIAECAMCKLGVPHVH